MRWLALGVAVAALSVRMPASAGTAEIRDFMAELHSAERILGHEIGRPNADPARFKEAASRTRDRAGDLFRNNKSPPIPEICIAAAEWLYYTANWSLTPGQGERIENAAIRFRRDIKSCEQETGIRQDRQFRP